MVKQLSSSDNTLTNDFVDNSERVLKDTVKVLQTCMATLISTVHENETKPKQSSTEQSKITIQTSTNDTLQSSVIHQKDSMIDDLNNKYLHVAQELDQHTKKHEEELT
jgi:molecular chaperone GrpE (heat shock protein)